MSEQKGKTEILWLENDPGWIAHYLRALEQHGFEVRTVATASEAEAALASKHFDLLIVDVMVPTTPEEEKQSYPSRETDDGRHTGLVFFSRHRVRLLENNVRVMVFTIRLDRRIRGAFVEAGLPEAAFHTRVSLSKTGSFLDKVKEVIGQP